MSTQVEPIKELNSSEVIEERLSDLALKARASVRISSQRQFITELALEATKIVVSAGLSGNVQCREGLKTLLPLIDRITKG